MVNKENMEKWAEALESGKYEQGTGTLCRITDDGSKTYCCLGVATVLAIADGVPLQSHVAPSGFDSSVHFWEESSRRRASSAYLHPMVSQWLGTGEGGDVELHATSEGGGVCTTATGANDGLKLTFPQIAALIRERYLS